MTELLIITKTTSPVTLSSGGNTYLVVSSSGAIYNLPTGTNGVLASAGLAVTNAGTIIAGKAYAYGTSSIGSGGAIIYTEHVEQAGTSVIIQAGGTLHNSGVIDGGGGASYEFYSPHVLAGGTGVSLNGTGTNSGVINGGNGVYYGGLASAGGAGLNLAGGNMNNTGSILGGTGGNAVFARYSYTYGATGGTGANVSGGATLVNSGNITGGNGGYGTNSSRVASGTGGTGVNVSSGTLITSGTISGGGPGGSVHLAAGHGDAVLFTGAGRLVIETGAVFSGKVVGDAAASDVLELAASAGGTFSDIGTSFVGFDSIALDAGPSWSLAGALLGETISGFTSADTLDITGVAATGVSVAGGIATFLSGTVTLGTLHLTGNYAAAYLNPASDGAGGTELRYVANEISGTITTGVVLSHAATTVFAQGLVEGSGGPAVSAAGLADAMLTNEGQILGGSFTGVSLVNGGTVVNAATGTIGGGNNAVVIGAGTAVVNNAGMISAAGGAGIYFVQGGTVINSGKVAGASSGLAVRGGAGFVTNTGVISGVGGDGIYLQSGGTLSNAATAGITGASYGILVAGAIGSISDAGTITGQSKDGLRLTAGGTASIAGTGHVTGQAGGLAVLGGAGAVVNAGSIGGITGDGLYFGGGAEVVNTGIIAGGSYGIVAQAAGTISNSAIIAGQSAAGVALNNGGLLSNGSTGHISGVAGLAVSGAAATVANAGSISATTGAGVLLAEGGSVGNTGVIISTGGGGVSLSAGGTLSNSNAGHISGGTSGVSVQGMPGTLANAGVISATSGAGIVLGDGGMVSLASTSTVTGSTYGVLVQSGTGLLDNAGIISGGANTGVDLADGGAVETTGTISGGNGVAVTFGGAGGNLLVESAAAAFGGNVVANGVNNTLELTGASGAGSLTGVGTKYTGFQTIAIDAGADWTISGALFGETITGFTGLDALDFTGIAADGVSIANGFVTLFEAGAIIGTLDVAGDFTGASLAVGSDGHGGTQVDLHGVVSTDTGSGISLSYRTTTITSTASIGNRLNAVYGGRGEAWTLVNAGSIASTAGNGVALASGGSVANMVSGNITGLSDGIDISYNGPGNIYNAGGIQGTFYGVYLGVGGNVTNAAHGTISGRFAISSWGSATIDNAGVLLGTNYGARLYGNSVFVTNRAGGIISGKYAGIQSYYLTTVLNAGTIDAGSTGTGVLLHKGGTVVNSGTIAAAAGGRALYLGGSGNRLVVDPGAVFTGNAVAAGSGNVLELASAATAGTISGIGTSFQGFGSIAIDLGAVWHIAGALFGDTISGLSTYDTLDLTGVVANSETYANGIVRFYENSSYLGGVSVTGNFGANNLNLTTDGAGTGTALYVVPATISGAYTNGITLKDGVTTIATTAQIDTTNAQYAVQGASGPFWQLNNYGKITSTAYGIYINTGNITNAVSGVIAGRASAVFVYRGDVFNAGTITSTFADGVYLENGTLTNAGTIASTHSDAVWLRGIYQQARLIIDPGAVFIGKVEALPYNTVDALELAAGSYSGTITGIGTSYTGFGTISIDTDASWVFAGSNALTGAANIASGATLADTGALTSNFAVTNNGLITTDPSTAVFNSAVTGRGTIEIGAGSDVTFNASVSSGQEILFKDATGTLTLGDPSQFSATVYGLQPGDVIDFSGIGIANVASVALEAGNELVLRNAVGGVLAAIQLDPAQNFAHEEFASVTDGAGGTEVSAEVMCFLAGTNIATPAGGVAVETLRIGELVLSADGEAVPVRWIGIHTAATRFADPQRVLPIRIKAGALGDGLPHRDLLVSPCHAMYLGGILIQAGALVNGLSILRESRMPERFVYYHVETAGHALILAEGAATETFVDNTDRLGFDNWAEHVALYGHEATIAEMSYPRAKSARQVPRALHEMLARTAARLETLRLSA